MNAATAKIVKEAITAATSRFPAQVWAFMEASIAADIKVAFAIEHAVQMMATYDKSATIGEAAVVTAAIRDTVYAG